MDTATPRERKAGLLARPSPAGGPRRAVTGPLPQVPWRDLEPVVTLEQRLPRLLLLLFGAVLAIQLVLHL